MSKFISLLIIISLLSLIGIGVIFASVSVQNDLDFGGVYKILNLPTTGYPANSTDAATKKYVDDKAAGTASGWTDDGTTVRLTTVSDYVGVGTASVDTNYKITTSGGGIKAESTNQPAGYFSSASGYGLIVNSGNVGIGTTGPGYKLDVVGTLHSSGAGTIDGNFVTSGKFGAYNNGVNANYIQFATNGGDYYNWYVNSQTNGSGVGTRTMQLWYYPYDSNPGCCNQILVWNGAGTMQWSTGYQFNFNGGAAFPGSGIWNTSGNVGIGTTGPGYKLDVQGGQINTSGGLCIAGDCKTAWNQVTGTNYWIQSGSNLYPNNTGWNVGIGTTGPSYKLQIMPGTGNAAYIEPTGTTNNAETGGLYIYNTNNTANADARLTVRSGVDAGGDTFTSYDIAGVYGY